jgi:hypothetical protein
MKAIAVACFSVAKLDSVNHAVTVEGVISLFAEYMYGVRSHAEKVTLQVVRYGADHLHISVSRSSCTGLKLPSRKKLLEGAPAVMAVMHGFPYIGLQFEVEMAERRFSISANGHWLGILRTAVCPAGQTLRNRDMV